MDYKHTLNLPRTDFAMKADLVTREPQRLARWTQEGLYGQIRARRAGAPRFVLHDGPPFANGDVHVGTALNKILKDIIVKYQTLQGRDAPYVPGWDCHGLPIEFKVVQELRKADPSSAADTAALRRACDAYARKYVDSQRGQFQRLGVLGDWAHPYLTLDKSYEADELRLFADLVARGYVYRGKKPVYWSIPCRTALAEAEVEYADHVSTSVYVKFPIVGHEGVSLLVWTTTPWTLPANLAVAYHEKLTYQWVRTSGGDCIVETLLLPRVAEACGWDGYEIVRTLLGPELASLEYEHPFCARKGRLFAAEFVDNTSGTGLVHIAPGHGADDYHLGMSHGLPIYSPVDDEGRLSPTDDLPASQQMPAALVGKFILARAGRSEANEAVIDLLRERAALASQADHTHSYPHCWRSKTPVIFRAMDQWFIRIDHEGFRARALEAIGHVQWVPDWGRRRIEGAVASRPDWCISRQRTWGVPIPAFYDTRQQPMLDARIVRAAADLIEQHGSNVWFETPTDALWKMLRPADWDGPEAAAKSGDTLDVWIDSGSSSRAVLMRRPELRVGDSKDAPAVADLYLEGSDQHRGWFQSSLLLSLAAHGHAPYRTVLTHGFMVDADREKISKSQQSAYQKPQTADAYVNTYGADVLRLWVASQDFRSDIVVSDERVRKVSETYRNLRNTLRYQLGNLADFDPARDAVSPSQLLPLDLWVLGEFAALQAAVKGAYDAYEFHVVYQRLSQFAAVELSALYHDAVKDRLYTQAAHSLRRRAAQTALHHMVSGLCVMLAPVLAFTADEAWELIPGRPVHSVHLADWPQPLHVTAAAERDLWRALFSLRDIALAALERARQAKLIGKALEARVALTLPQDQLAHALAHTETLRELLNVSQLDLIAADGAANGPATATVTAADGTKCERCWHCETSVGTHTAHPTLCSGCAGAVAAPAPAVRP